MVAVLLAVERRLLLLTSAGSSSRVLLSILVISSIASVSLASHHTPHHHYGTGAARSAHHASDAAARQRELVLLQVTLSSERRPSAVIVADDSLHLQEEDRHWSEAPTLRTNRLPRNICAGEKSLVEAAKETSGLLLTLLPPNSRILPCRARRRLRTAFNRSPLNNRRRRPRSCARLNLRHHPPAAARRTQLAGRL